VFGDTTSTFAWGGMTLGGAFSRTEPIEWVCIENGLGVGRTILKPTNPGYDEATGELNTEDGSDVSVTLCDVSGVTDFVPRDFDSCEGHPDEPFEGVGGSHGCFKNRNDSTYCCTNTTEKTYIRITQVCYRNTTYYGAPSGGSCPIDHGTCAVTATFSRSFELRPYDYDFQMDGNPALRELKWRHLYPDPTNTLYNSPDPFDNSLTNWNTLVGGTINNIDYPGTPPAYFQIDSVNNTKHAHWAHIYNPTSSIYTDGFIEAIAFNLGGGNTFGAGWCLSEYLTSDQLDGYYAFINSTTGVITLYYAIGSTNTQTVLASTSDATLIGATEIAFRFTKHGSTLTFEWNSAGVVGTYETNLTADHCAYTSVGHPGLVAAPQHTDMRFKDIRVLDSTPLWVAVEAKMYPTQVEASVPGNACPALNACNGSYESIPDVGTFPNCPGYSWGETLSEVTGASAVDPLSSTSNPNRFEDGFPADCFGPLCDDNVTERCGDCPPPFQALSLYIPSQCGPSPITNRETICRGARWWVWTQALCDE
jgi:hypothetical protein